MAMADENAYLLQEGDIVFSSSAAGQGRAIIDATGSPYTHCGIVIQQGGKLMVLEAMEPVRVTELDEFSSRSQPGTFTARRLISPQPLKTYLKGRAWGEAQIGRRYDGQFRWNDEKMYCSELVWKIYEKAGVRLCEPRRFRDYVLNQPSVRSIILERYDSMEAFPLDEKVVAPSDVLNSKLLVEPPKIEPS